MAENFIPRVDVLSDSELEPATPAPPTFREECTDVLAISPGVIEGLRKATIIEEAIVSWINHHLKSDSSEVVVDLRNDLQDGLLLTSLILKLTNGASAITAPHTAHPLSLENKIENVNFAFSLLEKEKLKVIYSENASRKVAGGSLKFIMEVCKSLIYHFHFTFGKTEKPACSVYKRLLLWLKVVLPNYKAADINPLDWQDGNLLASLLNFFTGSTCLNQELPTVIKKVEENLGIPSILKPHHLVTHDGEFVLLTYLYFFVKPGSPGQLKILEWVNKRFKGTHVEDFQLGWCDQHLLYKVVESLIPIPPLASIRSQDALYTTKEAIAGAAKCLSISPSFQASALSMPTTDPLPLILFLTQLHLAPQYPLNLEFVIQSKIQNSYAVGSVVSVGVKHSGTSSVDLQAAVQGENIQQHLRAQNTPENRITAFSFIPDSVGHFTLAIESNGSEIPGSPLSFDVYNPQNCTVQLYPQQSVYLPAQPVTLQVSTVKAGKGQVTAILHTSLSKQDKSASQEVIDELPLSDQPHVSRESNTVEEELIPAGPPRDGIHEWLFTPRCAGEHSIYVYMNNILVLRCPLRILVSDPSHCNIEAERAFAGLESCIDIIVPYDACLTHPKTGSLSVSIACQNEVVDNKVKLLKVDENKNYRKYRCKYTPPFYMENSMENNTPKIDVDVKWNGQNLPNSPFSIEVHETTPAQRCSVREYPQSNLIPNNPITAILDVSKAHKGTISEDKIKVEVACDGVLQQVSLKRSSNENNIFAVEFTPSTKGTYAMSIFYDEEPIPDNEIEFPVEEVCVFDTSSTRIHYPGDPITVTIDASSVSSAQISKKAIDPCVSNPEGKHLSDSVNINVQGKNMFPVQFTPQKPGKYRMDISLDNKAFSGPPLQFEVARPPLVNPQLSIQEFSHDDTMCIVTVNLTAPGAISDGFLKCQSDLKSSDAHDIEAVGKSTQNVLQPQFCPVKEGEFTVKLCTSVPDTYELSIRYYGQLLTCCPFQLDIHSRVVMYDPVIPFQVDNLIELVLDTSEAHRTSLGDFKIQVDSSNMQTINPINLVEDETHPDVFRASFAPLQDGDYKIGISWFSLPIPGSPFLIPFCQRTEPPKIKVSYKPLSGPRLSVAAKLSLYPTEESSSEEGSLVLEDQENDPYHDDQSITSSSLPAIALQQYERGSYQIWFLENQCGKYHLDILSFGKSIKGSPFLVDTTTIPKTPPANDEMLENMQIIRGKRCGFLAASVRGKKTGPTQITTLAVAPEGDEAVIKFNDEARDIYELNLYWYTTKYEPFKGAPFLLTKHHESAVRANKGK